MVEAPNSGEAEAVAESLCSLGTAEEVFDALRVKWAELQFE